MWPTNPAALAAEQRQLALIDAAPWAPVATPTVAGCFVCFGRGGAGRGAAGDRGWSAAATLQGNTVTGSAVIAGAAGGPYLPGLLALREGSLLEAAVRALRRPPDVLIVNATGLDHPRRAGLALHLGFVLDVPTVGITHRPLLARGPSPAPERGATSPLSIDSAEVACWLRVMPGVRPLVVHPGWRTTLGTAVAITLGLPPGFRTPAPLRQARRLAREARSRAS